MRFTAGKCINSRVVRSVYGTEILVEGQSAKTLNWVTMARYPLGQIKVAEVDACNRARKFSLEVDCLVTAYNCGGYGMVSYLKGEEWHG